MRVPSEAGRRSGEQGAAAAAEWFAHCIEELLDALDTTIPEAGDRQAVSAGHQDVCEAIVDSGGHYVLSVKENQPQLLAAISSEFAAQQAAFSPRRSVGTRGGA